LRRATNLVLVGLVRSTVGFIEDLQNSRPSEKFYQCIRRRIPGHLASGSSSKLV